MVRQVRCFIPVFIPVLVALGLSLAGCGGTDKVESGKRTTGNRDGKNASLKTEGSIIPEAGGAFSFTIMTVSAPVQAGAGEQSAEHRGGNDATSDEAGRNTAGNNAVGNGGNALGTGRNYSYVIVSASVLPVGARVSVIRAEVSDTCLQPGNVSGFSPVASGLVTTPGSVSLRFSDVRTSSFVEIIYIDSNDSGHLDLGDHIWGPDPEDPAGVCFAPNLALENRVNWDGVAAVIGGVSTYAGDGQDFLASAAGESQLPARSYIIGETGYENL